MPKEKFNPIAELPILPGTDIANDEAITNIIDATYPPIDGPNKVNKPQIEIRLKKEKKEGNNLIVVRTIILVVLIALVFLGIFLTLNFVPKMTSNISNFSKSFFARTSTTGTTTSTSTQTSAIPIATSTQETVTSIPEITLKQKTPAKLVATILSTNAVGNQMVVKFNIQNIGGTTSGTWSFAVALPSNTTPKYYSVTQTPLTPQSGVIYTLSFTADKDLPIKINIFQ